MSKKSPSRGEEKNRERQRRQPCFPIQLKLSFAEAPVTLKCNYCDGLIDSQQAISSVELKFLPLLLDHQVLNDTGHQILCVSNITSRECVPHSPRAPVPFTPSRPLEHPSQEPTTTHSPPSPPGHDIGPSDKRPLVPCPNVLGGGQTFPVQADPETGGW